MSTQVTMSYAAVPRRGEVHPRSGAEVSTTDVTFASLIVVPTSARAKLKRRVDQRTRASVRVGLDDVDEGLQPERLPGLVVLLLEQADGLRNGLRQSRERHRTLGDPRLPLKPSVIVVRPVAPFVHRVSALVPRGLLGLRVRGEPGKCGLRAGHHVVAGPAQNLGPCLSKRLPRLAVHDPVDLAEAHAAENRDDFLRNRLDGSIDAESLSARGVGPRLGHFSDAPLQVEAQDLKLRARRDVFELDHVIYRLNELHFVIVKMT